MSAARVASWVLVAILGGFPAAAAPPALAQEKKKVPLDQVLKGAVTAFDGKSVEVRYDFADATQLEDFIPYKAFQIEDRLKKEWFDRSLHLAGTGSIVWKPVLRKSASMEFDLRLKTPRDFGTYLAEDRPSDEMMVFSIYDQFFQNKDTRGSPKVHMICRFTSHAPDAGGDFAFRYCNRSPNPDVTTQKPFHVRCARDGNDQVLEIDGSKMSGADPWPALRGLRPGFYLIDSEGFVSTLVIRGEIDPAWCESAGVDPALPVKVKAGKPATRTPTEADIAARQKIEAVRAAGSGGTTLVPYLGNANLLDEVREEAAKVLEEAADLKVVPRLVSTMESEDVLARKLSGRVVGKLLGRNFGFAPEGPEEGRRKAVRSLLDYIEKNPAKFR